MPQVWPYKDKRKIKKKKNNNKIWQKPTYLRNRDRLIDIENRFVVPKWEGVRRGMDWEFEVSRCKLLHLEWISNEVLLYSTGNSIQSLGIEHDGK